MGNPLKNEQPLFVKIVNISSIRLCLMIRYNHGKKETINSWSENSKNLEKS